MDSGRVLAGRFELGRLVASGGMGSVHVATDRHTGARVALKLVGDLQPHDRERFLREAAALATLRHPSIVRYLTHGETDRGEQYLAMEWIEGESLAECLADGITVADAVGVVRQVALALGEAHRHGLIHRDVKPANIMLAAGEGGGVRPEGVRVVDFGLARRLVDDNKVTQTGMAVGTPGYMAPEQVRGERDVDDRLDIFALGCVLYECLAGHPPFEGETPLAVQIKVLASEPPPLGAAIPATLAAVVARMLAKQPTARFANMAEVVAALDGVGALPATQCRRLDARPEQDERTTQLARAADATSLVLASVRAPDDAWRARATSVSAPWPSAAVMADGTLVIRALEPVAAARCGLALVAALPDATIVVATPARGRDAVDRATRVLSIAALRAVFARGAMAGRAYVDADTAAQLASCFEVVREGPLLYLREPAA